MRPRSWPVLLVGLLGTTVAFAHDHGKVGGPPPSLEHERQAILRMAKAGWVSPSMRQVVTRADEAIWGVVHKLGGLRQAKLRDGDFVVRSTTATFRNGATVRVAVDR